MALGLGMVWVDTIIYVLVNSDEEKSLARRLLCTIASGLVFLFVKGVNLQGSLYIRFGIC